jgi:hypothetical protein
MTDRLQRNVRFVLTRLETLSPDKCAAHVELQGASSMYVGHAEAGCRDAEGLKAAALATAGALQDLGHTVTLEDVALITALGEAAVVVRVVAEQEGERRRLVGLSLAGDDPMRAAALAVLNATNRFFEIG